MLGIQLLSRVALLGEHWQVPKRCQQSRVNKRSFHCRTPVFIRSLVALRANFEDSTDGITAR